MQVTLENSDLLDCAAINTAINQFSKILMRHNL